jgi:tRNA pseudouridine13 synthase
LDALDRIAKSINISIKNIGFAGNKDKNAITEQVISIKEGNRDIENIVMHNIELKFLGKGDREIYLGRNSGNQFRIVMRNLDIEDIEKLKKKIECKIFVPNYFGEQRFSNSNTPIGRAIVKKDFKEAINLILGSSSKYNANIENHLKVHKNDFVVALKIIPFRMLKLYVHSYQSYLFNRLLERYTEKYEINKSLPLIGFGTKIDDTDIKGILEEIMDGEKLKFRDFIIYQIPELSSEGGQRFAYIQVNDFSISEKETDDLNKGKTKATLNFSLLKGCYATVLIDQIIKN